VLLFPSPYREVVLAQQATLFFKIHLQTSKIHFRLFLMFFDKFSQSLNPGQTSIKERKKYRKEQNKTRHTRNHKHMTSGILWAFFFLHFVCMHVGLFVCLKRPFVCVSVCLFVCLFACLSVGGQLVSKRLIKTNEYTYVTASERIPGKQVVTVP